MNRATLIGGLGIVLMVMASLIAQERPERQRRPRRERVDVRKYIIMLPSGTVAQVKQRLEVDENQSQSLEALAKEFDEKILQLRKEFIERCQQSLTAEQREGFDKMIKAEEERRNAARRPRLQNDPRIFRFVAQRLECTDEQKTQIEAMLEQHKANADALGENVEALKELNEQTTNQILALLTAEQREKLEELKQRRGRPRARERAPR